MPAPAELDPPAAPNGSARRNFKRAALAWGLSGFLIAGGLVFVDRRFGGGFYTAAAEAAVFAFAGFFLGWLAARLFRPRAASKPIRPTDQNMASPHIREVDLADLIKRRPVKVDSWLIAPHVEDRTVLVTGAGGSIGSELCRQIVSFRPKRLLLLGHGENSLFGIEQELRVRYQFTKTNIILADVADGPRIRQVFAEFRPNLVFHAAAHKHVPIVEDNVCEAVRNNIFGTHVLALAAAAAGVAKFVMVSTDKAVKPTSIMGATKAVSEQICRSFESRTGTEFVSVRFGNVLGSRGSVIGVFRQQIQAGGPITVTHPDMLRYFMTIPEAVALVLEAMAIGRDSQVFVMDMGQPVRVVELAEKYVTLSGLRPYQDIDIVFSGIRPGEKLREEVLTSDERNNPTINERLFIAQQTPIDYQNLAATLKDLDLAVRRSNISDVISYIQRLLPSFQRDPLVSDGVTASVRSLNGVESFKSLRDGIHANGRPVGAEAASVAPTDFSTPALGRADEGQ